MLRSVIGALAARFRRRKERPQAAITRTDGDVPDARLLEGLAHQKAGDVAAAQACYIEVLTHFPGHPDALHLLAILAERRGHLDQAESYVRRALAGSQHAVEYGNTLGSVLADMGRHAEAADVLRAVLQKAPDALRPRTNLLFLLHLLPGTARELLLAEHVEWARRHADPFSPEPLSSGRDFESLTGEPDRRLRIGYVSADFSGHPVGRILAAVLPHHDRSSFEILCYDNGSARDELNSILRGHADEWIEAGSLDDRALADRIHDDQIDVLVDLSGHTRGGRLGVFARRPAPVQATWLGYLSTTGVRAIDWRITDRRTDPDPDAQRWHVERLWYLPDCPWPWKPPASMDAIETGKPPSASAAYVTFGSFNTFRKLNDEVIGTWVELLHAVPDARLRVYGAPMGSPVERVYDRFESAGVNIDRVDLFASVEYRRYLHAYREIDIALDPFPYCGGATTCESLWMGVPVVTLAGRGGFARTAAGLLGAAGLEDFIAATTSDYVRIAAQLARDPARLMMLRSTLRERISHSPLADAGRFARNLEDAYKAMWRQRNEHRTNAAGTVTQTG